MRQSDSIAKLAPALVKAMAEVENATKNKTNPHFKNKYADLGAVLEAVKPVFASHGLAVVQFPGFADGVATLDSVIVHESGEWLAGTAGAPLQKADAQGVGSALTYLRRYSLAALAGIAQEDDDGQAASAPAPKARQATKAPPAAPVGAVADLIGQVEAMLKLGAGKLPAAGVTAATEAMEAKDETRLRAAVAWLTDQLEGQL